jgi:general secretion pathway protein D
MAAAPAPAPQEQSYTFNFHNADIPQVSTEILGKALGLSYTIDPDVTGKMSFQIEKRLTGAQLLEAFEAALESNDVTLVREGDGLAVKPRAKAKGTGSVRLLSEAGHGAGYTTLAVPLTYAKASEVAKAMQAVGPMDIVVYVDDKLGLLVLGGTGNELDTAVEAVRIFDRSAFEDARIRFFNLQEATAETVASDLTKILEAAKITEVAVVPLKRLNGLFAFAQSTAELDDVSKWVARLDVPSREKTLSLWVYHPRNLSADELSTELNGVMGSGGASGQSQLPGANGSGPVMGLPGATPSSGAPVFAGQSSGAASTNLSSQDDPVHIGVDKQSNTLLFSASPAHWVQIQKALDELDQTPNQVLIEASILEVTLNNQFNYGVDWSVLSDAGQLTVSSINGAAGKVAQGIPGMSVTFLGKDVQAAINALSERTAVEVVSSPKIVALDNHVAKLEVGDQVPVTTQAEQSTVAGSAPILNNVEYRSTGVILNVTPRIGGDGRVMLDISQEVSAVAQTTSSSIDSPTIQERKMATTLILDDGGVVALGGLISSNHTITDTGVPYLENVPWAGGLFKTHSKSVARTELIVLITAKIIKDKGSSQRILGDLLADMSEIRGRGLVKH